MSEHEFNISYYINIYKKWLKAIVLLISIAMFFTMCFSLTRPASYISTLTILSTPATGSTSALERFFGISTASGQSSFHEVIISILASRRMTKDIREKFSLDKNPKLRYGIGTRPITGGLAIDVKGSDPAFTQKIANFAIQNLDKINTELDITPRKPMVTVLDSASHGVRQSKKILRKMLMSGIFVFLLMSAYIFLSDYFKKTKNP
ncbi:hypothetical protein ACFL0P_04205 [Candidatus Omnitrophota bacterium]